MTFQEQVQLKVIACQSLGANATQEQVVERFEWLIADALKAAFEDGYATCIKEAERE